MKKEKSNIKKKLEEKIKLKLIEKFPHIHKLFLDGEITLKQAYDGSQSEMLGVETFKSKGTKKFITHSTKIKDSKSESPYPYPKHPLIESSVFNCEYEELLKMDFRRFKSFSLDLRKELLRVWNEEDIPPTIGKNRNDKLKKIAINNWNKLNNSIQYNSYEEFETIIKKLINNNGIQ